MKKISAAAYISRALCIYSSLSNNPVLFVNDINSVPSVHGNFAFCDGETLIDQNEEGTIDDIYCIMKNGSKHTLGKLIDAYTTLYGDSTSFNCDLQSILQGKTDIYEYEYDAVELNAILNDRESIFKETDQLWGIGKMNPARLDFGQGYKMEDFDNYVKELSTDDPWIDLGPNNSVFGRGFGPGNGIKSIDTNDKDHKAFSYYGHIVAFTSMAIPDAFDRYKYPDNPSWLVSQLNGRYPDYKFDLIFENDDFSIVSHHV